jgi:hypothetical protein
MTKRNRALTIHVSGSVSTADPAPDYAADLPLYRRGSAQIWASPVAS